MKKQTPIWKMAMADAVLACAALLVFALFHHVLPREKQSLNLVTLSTANAEEGANAGAGADTSKGTDASAGADMSEGADANMGANTSEGADASEDANTSGGADASEGANASADTSEGADAYTGTDTSGGADASTGASEGANANADADTSKGADAGTGVDASEGAEGENTVTLETRTASVGGASVTYHVADIVLTDVTALKTAFAEGKYGSGYTQAVLEMDLEYGALLCVNGDYYGNSDSGVVIRNGVVYRANATDADVLCLYYDGSMRVIDGRSFDVDEAVADGAYQAWTFGPSLLDEDGAAIARFSEGRHMNGSNPRTIIGCYEPGHYCIIVADGRGENGSDGLTLEQAAKLCEQMGLSVAYNLDGGKSSVMTFEDQVVNSPSGGGRAVSDCIYIEEASA